MVDITHLRTMPHELQTSADVFHQLEVGFRMIRDEIRNVEVSIGQSVSDFLTLVVTPGTQPLTTSDVKQEKDGHLEVDSEVVNGPKSEFEDPSDDEINEKLASFIQFLMTNRQPDDWFKTLYNGTHRPANVPALRKIQLNSAVNGVLQKEGNEAVDKMGYTHDCMLKGVTNKTHRPANVGALGEIKPNSAVKTNVNELDDKLAYTQNCMLKGVTKTAFVMDTLFKHVDKLPKELQPPQLMSDLNAAMTFFGEANLEFIQIRKVMLMQKLKSSKKELLGSESGLFRPFNKNTDTASIVYKVELPTRACGAGRGGSRYHPYDHGSHCNHGSST